MEQTFTTGLLQAVTAFNAFLWGAPMLILIVGISVYYTWKLKLIQRHLFHAIRLCTLKDRSAGVISNFGSFHLKTARPVTRRNPKTGAKVQVPSKQKVRFKPSENILKK